MRRVLSLLVTVFVAIAGLWYLGGVVAEQPTLPDATTVSTAASTTTAAAPACNPRGPAASVMVPDPVALLDDLLAAMGCTDHVTVADARDPYAVRTAGAVAAERGGPLLLWPDHKALIEVLAPRAITTVGLVPDDLAPDSEHVAARVIAAPAFDPVPGTDGLLLVAGEVPEADSLSFEAYARSVGLGFARVTASDLRSADASTRELVSTASGPIVVAGAGEDQNWQLDVVRRGLEIPGGGQILFPGRRIVALYGSPGFPALGVLGEQDAAGAVQRVREVAHGYEADGTPLLLGFEIISTIAASGPTDDGDYSFEQPLDLLRPWIEAAGNAGMYVLLDLQPGRSDFLTQAKLYEEFLSLPHVGLALDPEWRLGPNQVHLRQIGTVDAAEINQVSEWLAGLVREEALPQKLLLIHQFKLSMITNRETIAIHPELATVIQMDGQGPLGSKYGTWDALMSAGPNPGWWWGWKNFYDEDSPMATPAQVLELEPIPVLVTFQ